MFIKIHKSYRLIIAICDSDLVGKYFEEGERILDIKERFYKGDEHNEQEMVELIKNYAAEDATFNIAGEKSVQTALKAGLISEAGIMKVQGVPFALTLL